MYPFNKTQEPHIALSPTRTGKVDPETFCHINALRHWRRECLYNLDFAADIADFQQRANVMEPDQAVSYTHLTLPTKA